MEVKKQDVQPAFGLFHLFECQVRDQATTECKESIDRDKSVEDDVERHRLDIHLDKAKDVLSVAFCQGDLNGVAENTTGIAKR